eukprot:10731657-Alexandrium_andersonii.AAC.1
MQTHRSSSDLGDGALSKHCSCDRRRPSDTAADAAGRRTNGHAAPGGLRTASRATEAPAGRATQCDCDSQTTGAPGLISLRCTAR